MRIGVPGTGWGTRIVVPTLRTEGWDVAALWSRRGRRVRHQAGQLDVPLSTTDHGAVVERGDLDAVTVVTPTSTHRVLYVDALRTDKCLLLEPPLAMNATEAEEIMAAAAETKATTRISFAFRCTPQRLQVKQLLDAGYVSEVQHASIEVLSGQALRERGRTRRNQAPSRASPQGWPVTRRRRRGVAERVGFEPTKGD